MCEIIDIGINSGLCYGAAMRFLPLSLVDASVMMKLEFGLPLSRDDTFHSEVLKKLSSLIEGVESTRKNSQDNLQISLNQDSTIKEIKNTLAGQKRVTQNKQNDLADWVLDGMAQYCKKNQEVINDRINEGIHLPRKPTIIKMFNHWNRYLAADENEKATMQDYVPYPRYENILFDSKDNVEKWGEQIFAPTCLHERVKKKDQKNEKKRKSGKWKPDALDRPLIRGDKATEKIDELTAQKGEEDQTYFDEE